MFAKKIKLDIPYEGTLSLFNVSSDIIAHVIIKENDIVHVEPYNDIHIIKNDIDNVVRSNILQWMTGLFFPKCRKTVHFLANDIVVGSCTIDYIKNKIHLQQKPTYYWLQNYTMTELDRSHRSTINDDVDNKNISELLRCFCIEEDKHMLSQNVSIDKTFDRIIDIDELILSKSV